MDNNLEAQIRTRALQRYGTGLSQDNAGVVASHIKSNYQARDITIPVIDRSLEGLLDSGWVELEVLNPSNLALWQLRDQILFGCPGEQEQREFSLSLADYRTLHYQKIIRESDADFKTSHSRHLSLVNQLLELEPRLQVSFEGYCDLVIVNPKFNLNEHEYLDRFRTYITKLVIELVEEIPAAVWVKIVDFIVELNDLALGFQVEPHVNRIEFRWD